MRLAGRGSHQGAESRSRLHTTQFLSLFTDPYWGLMLTRELGSTGGTYLNPGKWLNVKSKTLKHISNIHFSKPRILQASVADIRNTVR